MKFKIISIGREKADPMAPQVDDYISRIRKFTPIDDVILKPGPDEQLVERLKKKNIQF